MASRYSVSRRHRCSTNIDKQYRSLEHVYSSPGPRYSNLVHLPSNGKSKFKIIARLLYEWPTILTGSYSSSRYFSSSSLNSLPRAASASSILSTLENPIMGLATRLLIHANATWLIFQSCFFAISSTRPIICLSRSVLPEVWLAAVFSPSERVVEPNADGGRARWPRQRGAH